MWQDVILRISYKNKTSSRHTVKVFAASGDLAAELGHKEFKKTEHYKRFAPQIVQQAVLGVIPSAPEDIPVTEEQINKDRTKVQIKPGYDRKTKAKIIKE